MREHLEAHERATGETPPDLLPAPFPHEIGHLWDWFRQISRMRQNNGMGVSPLSTEILTWQSLSHIELNPYELDVIWSLDSMYLEHQSKKATT
ncbi:hypothetical protein D0T23_05290 [Duganella sp. BJB475]|nr:hypothetical protein D0T23_05290 [Duganella sp. BJB475]